MRVHMIDVRVAFKYNVLKIRYDGHLEPHTTKPETPNCRCRLGKFLARDWKAEEQYGFCLSEYYALPCHEVA